jgi:hypothetical protein
MLGWSVSLCTASGGSRANHALWRYFLWVSVLPELSTDFLDGKRSLNANEPLMLYGAWRFIDWIAAYLKRACLSSEEILQSIHAKKIRLGV